MSLRDCQNNELSYATNYPKHIYFYCDAPGSEWKDDHCRREKNVKAIDARFTEKQLR